MSDTLNQSRRGPGRPSNAELAQRSHETMAASEISHDNDDISLKRRAARKPFGSQQQKLAYAERQSFHRHWFNDVEARLDEAKEAGYTFVEKDAVPVKRIVGTSRDGSGLYAYLMEIPQEWWEEDMRRGQETINETDRAIRRGEMIEGKSPEDSKSRFYPTAQGRKIDFK